MHKEPFDLERREFLKKMGKLGSSALIYSIFSSHPSLSQAQQLSSEMQPFPGKEKMIVLSRRPIVLEMPMEGFEHFITPNEFFFVRNNLSMPEITLKDWRLTITGEIKRPLTLTMEDLKKFPQVEILATLECYGNGRGFFEPKASGNQWKRGGVGTARWKGVRLRDILEQAGLTEKAQHVIFDGADEPFVPTAPDFKRSIPLEKALRPETLLAFEMNGSTLPIYHGFPLRVVVPGWGGSAWVKWLTNIHISTQEFDGFYMVEKYRHPKFPVKPGTKLSPKDMKVLSELEVKSIITSPLEESKISSDKVLIKGYAWTGEATIKKVEVSTDGGKTWEKAKITRGEGRYVWCRWEYEWKPPKPGYYTLMCRATDSKGRSQPYIPFWNQDGYLYNAIDRVSIYVV